MRLGLARLVQKRNHRLFSSTAQRSADFTHVVIGGGVVGLAIARKLQGRDGAQSILLERHGSVGNETSSRNSEVGNLLPQTRT
jgi:2-hydroxyglutarate dehydrogenase